MEIFASFSTCVASKLHSPMPLLMYQKVYITILASLPAFSASLRSSINRNLTEIVELHETILGELHRVVPHSEYTQFEDHHDAKVALRAITDHTHGTFHAHRRWKSMDAAAGDHTGCFPPGLHEFPGLTSDPQVAAEVSKIFGKRVQCRNPPCFANDTMRPWL